MREMKLQLIEKGAKIQDLESQAASLKRNNVIQAVELQVRAHAVFLYHKPHGFACSRNWDVADSATIGTGTS